MVELKLQLEVQNITINAFDVKRCSLYIVCLTDYSLYVLGLPILGV